MKNILVSAVLLCGLLSNAQTDSCQVDIKDNDYKNIYTTGIVFDQRDCSISIDIYKNIIQNNIVRTYIFFSGLSPGCVDDDNAYVHLTLKDGKKINLPYEGRFNCSRTHIGAMLSEENIRNLLDSPISKIKFTYTKDQIDTDVDEKKSQKLIDILKYINTI